VSRVQRPHAHITVHLGDESFQSIACTGTDNLTNRNRTYPQKNKTMRPIKSAQVNGKNTQKKPKVRQSPYATSGQETLPVLLTPEPAWGEV